MSRLSIFREKLKELDLSSAIILNELNQHYLSGFAFSDGFLLITHRRAFLVTDFRYYEMALASASGEFEVVMPKDRTEFINKVLSEDECKTVGFEGGYVSYSDYKRYSETHSSFEFVDIGNVIEVLRQVKTPEEIKSIQLAQDIADKAFSHILSVIRTDMTEQDVAVELEYAMRKNGAEGFSFDTIAVSGDASALPHGTPRGVKLKRGFLTMDFGAKLDGYCSDMTRTIVIGKADEDIKKLYNTVLEAQLSAIEYLKVGRDCGEADKAARDIINKDYDGAFGHSLGHAVGLLVHEAPALSPKAFGKKLVTGNVVTVEPGIYIFGKYGCRIEDMVAIEDNGIYNFTHSTKELIEIY